jgi:hypothetical protein
VRIQLYGRFAMELRGNRPSRGFPADRAGWIYERALACCAEACLGIGGRNCRPPNVLHAAWWSTPRWLRRGTGC